MGVTPEVSVWHKGTKLIEGHDYTVQFENNVEATKRGMPDMLIQTQFQAGLRAQVLTAEEKPKAVITGMNSYKDSVSKEFEIYYLPEKDAEGNTLYKISGIGEEYYTSEVLIVPEDGYAILANPEDGELMKEISIKEDGKHKIAFYIKRISDGALTEEIRLDIAVDSTAPTGEIRLDAKSWDKFLENITFGQYKVNDYQVDIQGKDETSGIRDISYVISENVYGSASELAAANLTWEEYKKDTKPEIGRNKNQVIYARLTDYAGNQTYISSEGILVDDIVPEIYDVRIKEDISLKDTQADITFTLNEPGTFYYAVLPEDSNAENSNTENDGAPDFEELKGQEIAGAIMGSGSVNADMAGRPITLTVTGLLPGTSYRLYVAAEDRTVELGTLAEAGNRSAVVKSNMAATKLEVPKITKQPEIRGIYGMKVCDMELIAGSAAVGENTVNGKFQVNSEEIPSVDSQKEYEVIFIPENNDFTAVSVWVKPKVEPRELTAEEVAVSEIQERFIYNGEEHKPKVEVSDSKAEITAKDYEIEYQNNINAGTATVVIRGKHNYTGERKLNFKIEKHEAEIEIQQGKENYQKTEGDADFKLEGIETNSDGKLFYQSMNEEVIQVNEEGLVHVIGKGSAVVQVLVLESGNFEASKIVEIQIEVAERKNTKPEETDTSPEETESTPEEIESTSEEIDSSSKEDTSLEEDSSSKEDTSLKEIESNLQESSNILKEGDTGQKKETNTAEKNKIDNGIQNTGDTAHVMRYMLILACTGIFVTIVSCRRRKR